MTINDFFVEFIAELRESLQRTPEILPALKEAGVVDSGGAGLLYIIEGNVCEKLNTVIEKWLNCQ